MLTRWTSPKADELFADLGAGADTLSITNTLGGYLNVNGGDGSKDTLNTSKMNFNVVRAIDGFEYQHLTTNLF
jgi:hypothetical protein